MRVAAALSAVLFAALGLAGGAAAERAAAPGPLELTISAGAPAYDLDAARNGNVTIVAQIRNPGGQEVLFAHPNVCVPRELREGESVTPDPAESHLEVEIETPSGATHRLTNNFLRLFEPGNRDHLALGPGATADFRLGWLSPYFNLGQWNIDQPVFTGPGTYRLTLRYHNAYPVAYVFGAGESRSRPVAAWTGTLRSNTVEVRVE
jgi:hypothetical protein